MKGSRMRGGPDGPKEKSGPEWLTERSDVRNSLLSINWGLTPLGRRNRWPAHLRSLVNLVLDSPLPMALLWGRDLNIIYNDVIRHFIEDVHPCALARPAREIWPEHVSSFHSVMTDGRGICLEEQVIGIGGNGRRDETVFKICCGAARASTGAIGGVLVCLQHASCIDADLPLGKSVFHVGRSVRDALDSFPASVSLKDIDGRFFFVNKATTAALKMRREKLMGSTDYDLLPKEEAEACRQREREAMASGNPIQRQFELKLPAGTVHFQNTVFPLLGADDSVYGVGHIAQNITKLKQTEERLRDNQRRLVQTKEALERANLELRDSEAKYRSIFEQAAIGIARVEVEGTRFIDANDTLCRMVGYSREEMERIPWPNLTHPEDIDLDLIPFSRMAKGQLDSYTVEKRLVHKHGHLVWARLTLALLRKADGTPDYEVAIVEDIDDRKQAEQKLLKSRNTLQAALASMTDAVVISDAEGRFIECNKGFAKFHGFVSEEECVENMQEYPEILDVFFADGRRVPFEQWALPLALRGQSASNAVFELRRKKTGRRWIGSFSFAPIRDEDGNIVGAVMVGRDITEQREVAVALEKANQQLQEADRQKNEFLAVLSHELRNPLAPIRYSLQVMDRVSPGGEQARGVLRVIDRQIGQITRIIEDLLDVTRISRGKIRLRFEYVDLREVLRRVYEDQLLVLTNRRVVCQMQLPDETVPVYGDPARLAQVVANLIDNAAKFSNPGGHVFLSLRLEGKGQAVLRVRDEGVGIPTELLTKIFEPSVQAWQASSSRRGGLGLGLPLVKGLVELHEGQVSAYSEGPGRGSVFTVTLPLQASDEHKPEPSKEKHDLSSRRVLIIEDDQDTAESLRQLIELMGHSVDVALDGEEGIEKAVSLEPDVVLCDIGLPKTDGYEVARALRAKPGLRSTLLVALSGYGSSEDINRSREAGFHHHLTKPPKIRDFEALLSVNPENFN